jgi:hypothetical protein
MSVLNYSHNGFECNYEVERDAKTVADKFKNHTTKEHIVDHPKEIPTNSILRKKP